VGWPHRCWDAAVSRRSRPCDPQRVSVREPSLGLPSRGHRSKAPLLCLVPSPGSLQRLHSLRGSPPGPALTARTGSDGTVSSRGDRPSPATARLPPVRVARSRQPPHSNSRANGSPAASPGQPGRSGRAGQAGTSGRLGILPGHLQAEPGMSNDAKAARKKYFTSSTLIILGSLSFQDLQNQRKG
jgi:hypothetical protein